MKRIVIIALVPLLLFPLACGKSREKAAEEMAEKIIESQSGGKAQVDISGGKITITSKEKGKEGTIEFAGGEGTSLPADFPKDVPVYPGASVLSHMKVPEGRHAVLKSKDAGADVYAFYQKKLPAEGWELIQEMKLPEAYTLVGTKGKLQTSVVIGKDDQGSTITVSVSQRG